jgi:hypothetical protein
MGEKVNGSEACERKGLDDAGLDYRLGYGNPVCG